VAEPRLTTRLAGFLAPGRRTEPLAALGLLLLLLLVAGYGIYAVLWGPEWGSLWPSLLLGALLGWGMARLRQSGLHTAGAALVLGAAFILLAPGGLGGRLAELLGGVVRWLAGREGAGAQGLSASLRAFGLSARGLFSSLEALAGGPVSGQWTYDPLAAALTWDAAAWALAAWAGWCIAARRDVLLAAAPLLLSTLAALEYGQRTTPPLYLSLGLFLLLLAVVQHDRRRQGWEAEAIAYPSRKGRQILNLSLLLTAGLVLAAGLLAAIPVQHIRDWATSRLQPSDIQPGSPDQAQGVPSTVPDGSAAMRTPGLPRYRLVGETAALSERVVMTVAVRGLSLEEAQALPLYWRGFTYDVYTGYGWSTSGTFPDDYPAGRSIQPGQPAGDLLLQQDVFPVEDLGGTVYAAGEPVTLDAAAQAAWRSPGDLFAVQRTGSGPYEAFSLLALPDGPTLLAAGQAYPDWVRQRFLSLPAEVPARVQALAARLTDGLTTPYQKALAIQEYLRTFPYTLDVPPPARQDLVDYFLFDLKKGYCDYFASAMVVLARQAGIPARLAVGYAPGTYNLSTKRFAVTEADAHSWAELYFPGVGWVPFEATPSRPVLDRAAPQAAGTPSPGTSAGGAAGAGKKSSPVWGWLLAGLGALAALLAVGGRALDDYRLRRLPAGAAAAELYRRLRHSGKRLAVNAKPGDTPYEFTAALQDRLTGLAAGAGQAALGTQAADTLRLLAEGIVTASYRPSPADGLHLPERWRKLRRQLLWLGLAKNWQALRAAVERKLR